MSEAGVLAKENWAQPSRLAVKRKADAPASETKAKKRSVLTDLTNAVAKPFLAANKKFSAAKKAKAAAAAAKEKREAADDNIALPPVLEIPEQEQKEEELPKDDIEDIDENCQDLYSVPEYAKDIFCYYREKEEKLVVQPYMERQGEVTPNMRAILVDWMVEVQENFELNHETLYLAVRMVDMRLAASSLGKAKLQLLGATAMLLASKFDERCPPLVEDFLYICDNAYARQDLLKLEQKLLAIVGFQLGMPLSYRFLRRFARCNHDTAHTLTLARYLLEMSLMNYELNVNILESLKAATVLYLARLLQGLNPAWPRNLVHHSGYDVQDFASLLESFHQPLIDPKPKFHVIRDKYSHSCFFEVSKMTPLSPEVLCQLASAPS